MQPGKIYVGRLPGHKEKVFARKKPRQQSSSLPPTFRLDFASKQRRHSFIASISMGFLCPTPRGHYTSYSKPKRYVCTPERDDHYQKPSGGNVTTSKRQTCAACGRFRSAKWEAAHPLIDGAAISPGICGRCKHKDTSSEEKESHRYNKRHHRRRHSHRYDNSTEDDRYELRDRSPRRYQSYRSTSREHPARKARASSRDNIRIVIANQPGHFAIRPSTRSSSGERVRLLRRESFIELPRRMRSRSRARSSSGVYYVDDEESEFEEVVRHRRRSRSRSFSRGSLIEEHRSTPRRRRNHGSSRGSFIEEDRGTPRRRQYRSSSRVHFVDDLEEPVLVSKPKRISRRRAIYFDGAGSFEPSENHELEMESRGRSRTRSRSATRQEIRQEVQSNGEANDLALGEGATLLSDEVPSGFTLKKPKHRGIEDTDPFQHTQAMDTKDRGKQKDASHQSLPYSAPLENWDDWFLPPPNPRSSSCGAEFARTESPQGTSNEEVTASSSKAHARTPYVPPIKTDIPKDNKMEDRDKGYKRSPRKRRRTDCSDSTDDEYSAAVPVSYPRSRAPSTVATEYLSDLLDASHISSPPSTISQDSDVESYLPPEEIDARYKQWEQENIKGGDEYDWMD